MSRPTLRDGSRIPYHSIPVKLFFGKIRRKRTPDGIEKLRRAGAVVAERANRVAEIVQQDNGRVALYAEGLLHELVLEGGILVLLFHAGEVELNQH